MDDLQLAIWLGRMAAITTADFSETKVCGLSLSSLSSLAGAQTVMAGTAATTA